MFFFHPLFMRACLEQNVASCRRIGSSKTLINTSLHVKRHILRTFIYILFVFVLVFSNKFRFPYTETMRIFNMKISGKFRRIMGKNQNDADYNEEMSFSLRLRLICIRDDSNGVMILFSHLVPDFC